MKSFRQKGLPGTVFAILVGTSAASWARDDEAIEACHNLQSTIDIVGCLGKVKAQWDKRLNAAYQRASKSVDPAGVPALRGAERAWLEYHKQRCSYLSVVPGTIGQVIGADCFTKMTKARALELEEDSKGLGPG